MLTFIRDQIEESDQLDYKASGALVKESKAADEIGKDISAFANSAGGTVIYGIKEFRENDKRHLPERLDPIDRSKITREWLEHQINRIEPKIPDLKIIAVLLKSGDAHAAYVVEIPKGTTAYQAPDGRYYRRYNFESLPMRDHEIRDVMNRRKHPSVETTLKMWLSPSTGKGGLHCNITNTGLILARYVMTSIRCPMEMHGYFLAEEEKHSYKSLHDGEFIYWNLTASNKLGLPLFPGGEHSHLFRFRLSPPGHHFGTPAKHLDRIYSRTYADEMPFADGAVDPINDTELI